MNLPSFRTQHTHVLRPRKPARAEPNAARLTPLILAGAMIALLAALWAGLVRLGWAWPALQPGLPVAHGPLMVAGFLGTLIGLERAVAARAGWAYAGPILNGLGGLALVVGLPLLAGQVLLCLGSLGMVAVLIVLLSRPTAPRQVPIWQTPVHSWLLVLGGICLLAGNLLWLSGLPVPRIVLWWAGFLILTIAAERLELGRIKPPGRRAERLFLALSGLLLLSMAVALFAHDLGARLAGAAMIGLAAWLLRNDIALFTVRKPGLPRFTAACLLSGFAWLGIAGLLAIGFGGVTAGLHYDAFLHSLFLGFVFAMIFGHAPIILPAITGVPIAFRRGFYIPLALLHLSLAARIAGDLIYHPALRMWGGLFNAVTVLLFLGLLASTLVRQRTASRRVEVV